jgi:hypothetical protein
LLSLPRFSFESISEMVSLSMSLADTGTLAYTGSSVDDFFVGGLVEDGKCDW